MKRLAWLVVAACGDPAPVTPDAPAEETVTVTLQAHLKGPSITSDARVGVDAALSADGATLALLGRDGLGVHIYTRTGQTWTEEPPVAPADPALGYASALALSADGSTLAVGAEDAGGGLVYVFSRSGTTWSETAQLRGSVSSISDFFGSVLALSHDGSILAVGAPGYGDAQQQTFKGAVFVFRRTGTTWTQAPFLEGARDTEYFGQALALDASGDLLAVSTPCSAAPGAVNMFGRAGDAWQPQASITVTEGLLCDFAESIALTPDGNTLVAGASQPLPPMGTEHRPGEAWVFARTGSSWTERAALHASNPGPSARFGFHVASSADGTFVVVGAIGAGSGYVLHEHDGAWTEVAMLAPEPGDLPSLFGYRVLASEDARTLVVTAPGEGDGYRGGAYVFSTSR